VFLKRNQLRFYLDIKEIWITENTSPGSVNLRHYRQARLEPSTMELKLLVYFKHTVTGLNNCS